MPNEIKTEIERATTGPGAPVVDDDLRTRIDDAVEARRARPRTTHTHSNGRAKYVNRLALETSPYLQQHAHNPVDWHPWGDDAFARARAIDRPILLSIGYATCHWCHVMEEESFEDLSIARFINGNFIAVKVDREERPDVDAVYMAAVQAMTGHGGWPMTTVLNHARVPFFGGTYFPAHDGDRGSRRGFLSILKILDDAWRNRRDEIAETTTGMQRVLEEALGPDAPQDVDLAAAFSTSLAFFRGRFDSTWGGMRVTQKFPSSLPVRLLLRLGTDTDDDELLQMARVSLDAMARGGIHDHLGGGFHRYAVDAEWLVPHFEKMLYDNALLLSAYAEAAVAFSSPAYKAVAQGIVRFLDEVMTAPDGTFYSATDADSPTPQGPREEGYVFTWTPDDVRDELSDDDAAETIATYALRDEGNFEHRNVLHLPRHTSVEAHFAPLQVERREAARRKLMIARNERPPPIRDEKRLTSWNGLMIAALARAGTLLNEPTYVDRAKRAAFAILAMEEREGQLMRVQFGNDARIPALLDDHAFLASAALAIFEATGDASFLAHAIRIDAIIAARFEDLDDGGFFTTPHDHPALLVREKATHDGAEPGGASIHVDTLVKLAAITGDDRYRARAQRTLSSVGAVLSKTPHALSEMLVGAFSLSHPPLEIVLTGSDDDVSAWARVAAKFYLPSSVVIRLTSTNEHALTSLTPLGVDRPTTRTAAYLCERGTCALPSNTIEAFEGALRDRVKKKFT